VKGDKKMRAKFIAFLMTLALCGLLTSLPAMAATPQGSCPPKFPAPIAISDLPADLQDFATFLDTEVGGNNDGLICVTPLAPKAKSDNGTGLNVLDNRVAGF
jgi:hypothetical protein